MPPNRTDMMPGKRDTPLDTPIQFRIIIEGAIEAPDMETVRAFCLANISFTAGFGQMVAGIHVQTAPQKVTADILGADGVKLSAKIHKE